MTRKGQGRVRRDKDQSKLTGIFWISSGANSYRKICLAVCRVQAYGLHE